MIAMTLSPRFPIVAWARDVALEWDLRRTAIGLGLGLLSAIQSGMLTISVAEAYGGLGATVGYLLWWLYHACQFGLPIVFAVCVADRAVDEGVGRLAAYGTAVAVALALGGWAGNALVGTFDPRHTWGFDPPVWIVLRMAPIFGLGVAIYADFRHERRMLERARARELQRARQQQHARAAQLLALQARVEPQLLFDTMKRIENLIATSPGDADALLADLIAMLRAMLPTSGAAVTTLEREVALVESYGRVLQAPALQAPALTWRIAANAAPAVLAPMVLLPALKSLAAAGASELRVGAERDAGRLHLRVAAAFDPGRSAPAVALNVEPLRERLASVHGDGAILDLEPGPTTTLDINLPFHDDESTHR